MCYVCVIVMFVVLIGFVRVVLVFCLMMIVCVSVRLLIMNCDVVCSFDCDVSIIVLVVCLVSVCLIVVFLKLLVFRLVIGCMFVMFMKYRFVWMCVMFFIVVVLIVMIECL